MLQNKEGQNVPNVSFQIRENDEWKTVTSDDLFKNKKVIVFSLPGAFTPTCSSTHLPRYNELAPTFFKNGVDSIICLSVNDTFVMNAWKSDQDAENVTFLPDGNGDFSREIGMLVDKKELGFGPRSWRYSMFVENGTIKKMFIEPEKPGDPFEVSDADTMLEFVAPTAKKPEAVSIITKPGCPFCAKAKSLLKSKNIAFEEIVLGTDATSVSLRAITGRHTVPQVFIEGKYIGGSEELENHLKG